MWTSPSDPVAQAEPTNEAIATAPEQNAPETDPLAALWQVTVERFSQAAFPSGGNTSPQTASMANLLFNQGDPPAPAANVDDNRDSQLLSKEPSDGSANLTNPKEPMPPETAPVADSGNAEAVAEARPLAIAPPAHEVEVEPAAIPDRLAPPSWANAKEGSQPVAAPVTTTSPIPGAFPDSTIYRPQPSEQVSTDDLSVETAPAKVERAGKEAIAPPMPPSQVITPDTAREGASLQ